MFYSIVIYILFGLITFLISIIIFQGWLSKVLPTLCLILTNV